MMEMSSFTNPGPRAGETVGAKEIQAEPLPLLISLLQVLRMVHFLRKCTMRKTCKKSFRSPKATMLRDRPARLNESIAPTVSDRQHARSNRAVVTYDCASDCCVP